LEAEEVDPILLDIQLPDAQGIKLSSRFKKSSQRPER
jgi:CheY-like chemotaxis protein